MLNLASFKKPKQTALPKVGATVSQGQMSSFLSPSTTVAANPDAAAMGEAVQNYQNGTLGAGVNTSVPVQSQSKPAAAKAPGIPAIQDPSALPKIDYKDLYSQRQQDTARQNAIRTKGAKDTAEEQAYRAGATPGTRDYESFLMRSQAGADSANLDALSDLANYGTDLAMKQETSDRQGLEMMLDAVGDDPDAKRKLVSAFLSGSQGDPNSDSSGSVDDIFAGLVNDDGTLSSSKTDYDKAVQSELEYLMPAALDPSSEYYGMSEDELRQIAGSRISWAHDDQYRDQTNEKNLTGTVDKVIEGVKSGSMDGITNGEIHTAIKHDDTGMLRDSITNSAVGVSKKDFVAAAEKAGAGGFIMDSEGTLYRVVSVSNERITPAYSLDGLGGTLIDGDNSTVELYDVDTGKIVRRGGRGPTKTNVIDKAVGSLGNLF